MRPHAPVRPRLVLLDEVTACVDTNTAATIRQVGAVITSTLILCVPCQHGVGLVMCLPACFGWEQTPRVTCSVPADYQHVLICVDTFVVAVL
jgi:hypothetical protein